MKNCKAGLTMTRTSTPALGARLPAQLLIWGLSLATLRGQEHGDELLVFPKKPVDRQLLALEKSIRVAHEKAIRGRKPVDEVALRRKLAKKFDQVEARLGKLRQPASRARGLSELALLAAELAWVERVESLRAKVVELDPKLAGRLGHFAESEHFVARVVGADAKYAKAAIDLAEAARKGYAERFGLDGISKVPGKRVRLLLWIDADHAKPRLWFHPSPPWHSELRFVAPEERFLTRKGGLRIVYGFAHEMGHMLAMWGRHPDVEDDRHAWAHYTGCLIVEDIYDELGVEPWPTWTSYQRKASGKERLLKQLEGKPPGRDDYDGILRLFHTLGEELGTESYGRAWKWLAKKKRFRRVQRVPYLWLDDLRDAMLAVHSGDKAKQKCIAEIFPAKGRQKRKARQARARAGA